MEYFVRHRRLRTMPQKESQKFKYIAQVIEVLAEGPSFPTKLTKQTGLSPKSVIGTLRILEERKIVSKKQDGHKKIYELHISQARNYLLNGSARSLKKRNPRTWKVFVKAYKSLLESCSEQTLRQDQTFLVPKPVGLEFSDQYVPLDYLIPGVLPPTSRNVFHEYEEEYTQLFPFLRNVSPCDLPDLFIRYRNRQLCISCLEAGRNYRSIVETRENGETVCKTCGTVIE